MNLIIYINEHFEDERALFDLDNNKILLMGDYYHDKIDAKIEGYLLALDIDEDDVAEEWIDKTHKHFKQLGFYER
jgi:hypothetical protein